MKRRDFLKAAGAVSLGMGVRVSWARAAGKRRPNILFIMTDQQFAEIMSCVMGGRYINTPAMDRLVGSGMRFTRAYTANPLCMPARGAIFSGRFPHETGIQSNDGRKLDLDELPAMGTYFKAAGYDTGYVGKWHLCYNQRKVQEHGFDMTAVLKNNGYDDDMPEPAVEFIKKRRENPFLLVVSFSNPHDICQWSRFQKLPSGEIGEAPEVSNLPPVRANHEPAENETDTMALMRKSYHNTKMFPVGDYTEQQWRRLVWGYYRLTEKVDALIGKVLDALRESGQEGSTLVVFTSDHGDCHGAHRFNQKTVFYEESTRVPFIMSYKGVIQKGTADRLVNTGIDIMPTLFDYAGIDLPKRMPGVSLRGVAEGKEPGDWRKYVVVQNYMVQGGPVDGETPKVQGRMVRSERYKYCVYDRGQRREALFDMDSDPGEMKNIAYDPSKADVLELHRGYLREHAVKYKDEVALSMPG